MIFNKENDELMLNLAVKNKMDMDKIISAYLVAGDEFFMLLHIFEGQTLKVPSKRRLNAMNAHNIKFIEDDERKYRDYKKKEYLEYNGESYIVVSEEKKLLNHYYIPVIPEDVVEEIETDD